MRPITFDRAWPLHGSSATRQLEARATAAAGPHVLMQRAGLAVARLAQAVAPHARQVWIACGPGNNGGDGLEAAMHLQRWGKQPCVQWFGDERRLAPDAAASLQRARAAGVPFTHATPELQPDDLAIDALLGLGSTRPATGDMAACVAALNASAAPVLAIDLPTGLAADTGQATGPAVRARYTLSLLTLKPGLFTGTGRDLAGQVWFDALQDGDTAPADAVLAGPPPMRLRAHASHKGSYGDVAVLGGAPGMRGAAVLAGSAALHAGAGRVYIAALDASASDLATDAPELMWRAPADLPLARLAIACGCGGGPQVAAWLPQVLAEAAQLVLDADALNAVAADIHLQDLLRQRRQPTVLTPHPLEAARLLESNTAAVQADRLAAAQALAERFGVVAVLKGSGTVVTAPGRTPAINPTGNARLATAGTGDVLAGFVAARLAAGAPAWEAACHAVFQHGALADAWPADQALTASALARAAA
ncbi:bifunctional ADP-dependent NAD(P)H-hydrate dehydratase/NAD(P)H-hydrate epimerase [Pseudorhodoferax sp. Leaf274]|uniref:bifunctional ADP-dependent NAD(P)H-hydrate dehydratase/NAD(P)H-hydrate epimerase n=1 Tax=Pseudorhodoferax sp. Leaf274 TaxID=1736318 RepID=UPI0007026973|nr:bifunctional ADP-dependent NAD(P)H-hydrate dehydratase/NAD(P)H-hydrate epimerase [Pseudorhodoferax sp. Leaf274]KQP44253.1 carbohydrate kinase [Pseudorhodoferax sp. Leaf274]